jgi:SAM-dependent methyltransferase
MTSSVIIPLLSGAVKHAGRQGVWHDEHFQTAENVPNLRESPSGRTMMSMSFELASLTNSLEQHDDGLWWSRSQAAVSYPAQGNAFCLEIEDGSFWFRHRNRCIASLVRRFAPASRFLDIGAGNGYVAKGLIEAGIDCVLVEPGVDGARAAHARGIDPVICARLEDSGFLPAAFGAAGMFDVLEHIEDDVAALQQVRRLLAPGGRVFLTVPAYTWLMSVDDVEAGHFRRYTRSSLSRVLAQSGFRVEYASYMFAALPAPIFLLRTVPTRLGLRRGTDPARDAAEHAPDGLQARLMDRMLAAEYRRIDAGKTIPFG